MQENQSSTAIYEDVLYSRENPELSRALLHELIAESVHGTITEELQEILDEYVKTVEEAI